MPMVPGGDGCSEVCLRNIVRGKLCSIREDAVVVSQDHRVSHPALAVDFIPDAHFQTHGTIPSAAEISHSRSEVTIVAIGDRASVYGQLGSSSPSKT